MSPKICEHYIVRGLCDDYPDWSITTPRSETSIKIGYEYGHSVTGEEQQIKLNLVEEAFHTDSDQVVASMVATSAKAFQELGLNTPDLVDEEPSIFHSSSQPTSQEHQSPSVSAATNVQEYKKHCRKERKKLQDSAETPPALLPVSFAQAKGWLFRKQKA